jgi:hypothetical protein
MNWDSLWPKLERLAAVFGRVGAITLITIAIAAALLFLQLVLEFGHGSVEMFVPFVRDILVTLLTEHKKSHPAIRFEFGMHIFFGLTFFLCFAALLLHALIPWHTNLREGIFYALLVTSFVVTMVLAGISFKLAARLP